MSWAKIVSDLLEYDKHITLFFSRFIVEYDNKIINLIKNIKDQKTDLRKLMNSCIRDLKCKNLKLLYIDDVKKSNKYTILNLMRKNQQILGLIHVYNGNNYDDFYLDEIPLKNLEFLSIINKSPHVKVYFEYSNIIKSNKNLKYLLIDHVSEGTCCIIENCHNLKTLSLQITQYSEKECINNLNIVKNVRCSALIISTICPSMFIDSDELKKFIVEMINTIIENKFLKKVIISRTAFVFIFDGNLLKKIESSGLLYFQINDIKLYPQEIFRKNDFHDINLNYTKK